MCVCERVCVCVCIQTRTHTVDQKLELPPHGGIPLPTSQATVYIHVYSDIYAMRDIKSISFFCLMEVFTLLTCMILHLTTTFTGEYKGQIGSFITWCNSKYLKLNISKNTELVVDYYASNIDVEAKNLQILKLGCFTYISNPEEAQKI